MKRGEKSERNRVHHRGTEDTEKSELKRGETKWRFVQVAKMKAT